MNILVLGGNGYLGSKMVNYLVAEGENVTCTKRPTSDVSRVQSATVKWISTSANAIDTEMRKNDFDFVLNMSCNYGHQKDILYNNMLEANLEFPMMVLNLAVAHRIQNFLTIGTGLPDTLNMYSYSKKLFGELGKFYAENHKLNFFHMKMEMFYGADEPKNRFLPSVIHKMILGAEVDTTLGTQKRDVIFVNDAVNAIIMTLHTNMTGYQEIPVGTGQNPTIAEVVELIWDETGNKSKWNKGAVKMRVNEPDTLADTTILKSIGEWNPIDWKVGIHKMVHDIKTLLQ